LPMTGLPEKAEVPMFSGGGFGGAWIRWFISFRVTSPSSQDGLIRVKGYAIVVVIFCFTLIREFSELPAIVGKAEPNDQQFWN
jgi:hypothetical protein